MIILDEFNSLNNVPDAVVSMPLKNYINVKLTIRD